MIEKLKSQQTNLVLQRAQAKDQIDAMERAIGQLGAAINALETAELLRVEAAAKVDKEAKAKAAEEAAAKAGVLAATFGCGEEAAFECDDKNIADEEAAVDGWDREDIADDQHEDFIDNNEEIL